MDNSPIQSALCVIGHPIGGNPSQFVSQRALLAMGFDWQFMSFDVEPAQFETAIRGMESLGFRGAIIADPYQAQVASALGWNAREGVDAQSVKQVEWFDCLYRDESRKLLACNALGRALQQLIQPLSENLKRCVLVGIESPTVEAIMPFLEVLPEHRLAIAGSKLVPWPVETVVPPNESDQPASNEANVPNEAQQAARIDEAPLFVVWNVRAKYSKKGVSKLPVNLDPAFLKEFMERLPAGSIVLDLTSTSASWGGAVRQDMHTLLPSDLEVARLAIALQCWTGQEPSTDLMREAIEEYLEI